MMIELVLIGTMTATSYQPIPSQTKPECRNRHSCETSIGDAPTKFGCAASQDLLASGEVHYGDVLYVPGFGYRIVNDTMNVRNKRAIDLLVYSKAEEKKFGVRHLKIYRMEKPQ